MNTGTDRRRANWHWKENDVLLEFAPEIGAAAVCVYDVLTMFARGINNGSEREAWPSIARIAKILGFSPPTVRQAFKKLEDAGLVRIERRMTDGINQTNHYTLLDVQDAVKAKKEREKAVVFLPGSQEFLVPVVKNLAQGGQEIYPGVLKKTADELDNEEHRQFNNEKNDDDDDGTASEVEPSTGNRQMVTPPFVPVLDEDWGAAFRLFQTQLGWMGGAGPTLDEMREFFDELRTKGLTDWWALAVKVAVDQNARSWAYVRATLRNALDSNCPPGAPNPKKGTNGTNGAYRNGHRASNSGNRPYDDGLSTLSPSERKELSAQLAATRNRQRGLPGL